MLDRILKIEEQLIRVEALLLVISVLLMLGLATYNVFYRNVLVPIQVSVLTDDEPTTEAVPEASTDEEPVKEAEVQEPVEGDGAGDGAGFGGGFGDDEEEGGAEGFGGGFGDDEAAEEESEDETGGFGGGFGDDDPDAEPDPDPDPDPEPEPEPKANPTDDSGGFGGGFGDDPPQEQVDDSEGFGGGFGGETTGDDSEGFGGGFGSDDADAEPSAKPPEETTETPTEPAEVPWFAAFVDAVKLEWIDVLLRQLVLVVGFLGAMIAARRRKHITIDALSKVMPAKVNLWVAVFTSALSTVVCLVLAKAGSDLVAISVEFPKELVSWADEWHFQLAFPIGFGMLALHFAIRVLESLYYALGKAEPPKEFFEGGAV